MPKRIYCQWTEENMNNAIEAYRSKKYGFNECCRRFNIPKPTFKRHLEGTLKRSLSSKKRNGTFTTLPEDVEFQLVEHIIRLESSFFGLSIRDIRSLAYQIAEKNNLQHKFNRTMQLAGKKWFYAFLKRHPKISVRQPENTSINRAKGFNREAVSLFFDLLETIVRSNGIDASRIFNMDESGFTTVQKKCAKIIAEKGKKKNW